MTTVSLHDARTAVVRERVLNGVAELLAAGDDVTFAKVAAAAAVPERTVYRHFPTREALLTAVYEWANRSIGYDGERPTNEAGVVAMIRRVFPSFDELAPVIRELLRAPEGLPARLSDNDERRRAAAALVRNEAPGLGPTTARRVAAAVQLLTSATTWQALHDYWDMDGKESAETAALAIDLVLAGARARASA